ncbi:MAG TPA: extracellular solute-binding protein [Acetobacteraceae bacterium]|jgi:iron(III) transport system substrate-binding protein|nr:extracellular solute-binding protein [Acetobacteraceae bacterium]
MNDIMRRSLLVGLLGMGVVRPGRLSAQERQAAEEGAKKEGAFALATSVSVAGFPKFMDAFKAKHPYLDVTSGYYSAPTGRVLARVYAEMDAGSLSFDVLHVASLAPYLSMTHTGQLQPYHSPELAGFPDNAHGGDLWTSARIVGVIMAYNSHFLAAEKAPKSWTDLLRPEFRGRKLIIQDSAAGTTFNQMYILEKRLGTDFMKRWGAQQPLIVATAPQLIDLLNRGEALVGATVDHYRAFEAEAIKSGIVGVYPTEGMPVTLAPVGILKGAPHPNAARLFIDFTLSREGNTLLAHDIFNVYSSRPDVPAPAGQLPFADTKPLFPQDLSDYEVAAANFPERFDTLFKG